jgi:hypothetical protein
VRTELTRRVLLGAGTAVALAACSTQPAAKPSPDRGPDPDDVLSGFASSLSPDAPYRPPTQTEREDAAAALLTIAEGLVPPAARATLQRLGFSITEGTDPATGRRYALVLNELGTDRAWGVYLADLTGPATLAVEVPHPNFDLHTERLGVALHRQDAGSMLLMAGAHRRAADGAADVAHREDSLFHAVATGLAERKLPQVQLHGFHDASLPGAEVVISAGAADASPMIRTAAGRLAEAGFGTCRAWAQQCGDLEGTRNVQGKAAARLGTVFIHVECARTVRDDPARRAALVRALG